MNTFSLRIFFYSNFVRIQNKMAVLLGALLFAHLAIAEKQASIAQSSISNLFSQSAIMAIHRDREGILWVGSEQGLYRYDGADLEIYSSQIQGRNRIPSSVITAISEDASGKLLVTTFGADLLQLDDQSGSFGTIPYANADDQNSITDIATASDGSVWLATRKGVLGLDLEQPRKEYWSTKNSRASTVGQAVAVAVDDSSNVVVASHFGLFLISPQNESIESLDVILPGNMNFNSVTALEFGTHGQLFIGTKTGHIIVFNLNSREVSRTTKVDQELSSSVSELLYKDGLLWIGTNHGLSYTNSSLSFLNKFNQHNSDISNNQVTSLYGDEKFIWVGTAQGLNIVSFSPFVTFNNKVSNISEDVLAFDQDRSGRLWVGTYNGLYFVDPVDNSHLRVDPKTGWPNLIDQRVMTIAHKGHETWIGFRYGGIQILRRDSPAITLHDLDEFKGNSITKILHASGGDTWIATYDKGLIRLRPDIQESFYDNGVLPEKSVTLLLELPNSNLLVGTENNIYVYEENTESFKLLPFNFGKHSAKALILSMAASRDGNVWIGTKDRGLFLWSTAHQLSNNLKVTQEYDSRLPPTTTVYGIQFDSQDQIWCSTHAGIMKLDGQGHFLASFTLADGIQGNEFNFGASFKDREGRIYFGGINGYTRFDPNDIHLDSTAPKLLLTGIDFTGRSHPNKYQLSNIDTIQLTHKNYFVSFTFSVLDFLDPEKNQFRYKLENFDPEWIENGTRNTATYTNLPPGEYVLRVQGANSSGVWNREGISLKVIVLPAPWLTWWAYCFYATCIFGLAGMGKRAYDSYSIERRAIQLAKEKYDAENKADDDMQEQLELQDDIVKSTYSHNVATLSLIKDFISWQADYLPEQVLRDSSEGNIDRIEALSLLESCLHFHNDGLSADLHKYVNLITSRLLENAPIRQESITTINEIPGRRVPAQLASPLAILIFELLENCIQHAFELESLANYIQLSLEEVKPELAEHCGYRLTVQDNGVGIPESLRTHMGETPGLAIILSITKQLGCTLKISTDNGTKVIVEPELSN